MPRKSRQTPTPGDPLQTAVRARRRETRYGANPRCVLCGEGRPESLLHVTREFIEFHHLSGVANDADLIVPLCLNCHRKVTEAYAAAGVSMGKPDTPLHRLLALLRGLSVFHQMLGVSLGVSADQLQTLIDWAHRHFPGWRAGIGGMQQ